jgi:antitoxin component of MazEF toxin-antitoxin module
MELIREIKKIGNGNYISIPATLIKENILQRGHKYKIIIQEADLNESEKKNNNMIDYRNFI